MTLPDKKEAVKRSSPAQDLTANDGDRGGCWQSQGSTDTGDYRGREGQLQSEAPAPIDPWG